MFQDMACYYIFNEFIADAYRRYWIGLCLVSLTFPEDWTLALLQSDGTSPVISDAIKMLVRIGAISVASSFSILRFRFSGTDSLFGLIFVRSFSTTCHLDYIFPSKRMQIETVYLGWLFGQQDESVITRHYVVVPLCCQASCV